MKTTLHISALVPAFILGAALACSPALGWTQSSTSTSGNGAKQDMKNAGTDTKNATQNAAHGTEKGTKKAYNATKNGTKKAATKTSNTTKGAVNGAKAGAKQPN